MAANRVVLPRISAMPEELEPAASVGGSRAQLDDDAAVAQLLPGAESAIAQMLSGDDDDEAALYESDDEGIDGEPHLLSPAGQHASASTALGSLRESSAAHQHLRNRWVAGLVLLDSLSALAQRCGFAAAHSDIMHCLLESRARTSLQESVCGS